jgi:hypothetical protein
VAKIHLIWFVFGVVFWAGCFGPNQNQHKLVDMLDFNTSFSGSGELDIPPLHIKETTD